MMAETEHHGVRQQRLSEHLLLQIYASDQDMYPAGLTYDRLRDWVEHAPDLSICFESLAEDGSSYVPVGAIIVLPLVRHEWENLLGGTLKEPQIESKSMFPGEEEVDIGLHVFHIERFDMFHRLGLAGRFAELALQKIQSAAAGKPWNVLGYSGMYGYMVASKSLLRYKNLISYSSDGYCTRQGVFQPHGIQLNRVPGAVPQAGWR